MSARRWYIVCERNRELFLDFIPTEGNATAMGKLLILRTYHNDPTLQWEIDDTQHSIMSVDCRFVVDIGSHDKIQAGNDVILWRDSGARNQRWVFDPATRAIISPCYNLALEPRNFAVHSSLTVGVPCGSAKQQWRIFSVGSRPVDYSPWTNIPPPPMAPLAMPYGGPWAWSYDIWVPGAPPFTGRPAYPVPPPGSAFDPGAAGFYGAWPPVCRITVEGRSTALAPAACPESKDQTPADA
jgi:hypothetical protein